MIGLPRSFLHEGGEGGGVIQVRYNTNTIPYKIMQYNTIQYNTIPGGRQWVSAGELAGCLTWCHQEVDGSIPLREGSSIDWLIDGLTRWWMDVSVCGQGSASECVLVTLPATISSCHQSRGWRFESPSWSMVDWFIDGLIRWWMAVSVCDHAVLASECWWRC